MDKYPVKVQLSNGLWVGLKIDDNYIYSTSFGKSRKIILGELYRGVWFESEYGYWINPAHVIQVNLNDDDA